MNSCGLTRLVDPYCDECNTGLDFVQTQQVMEASSLDDDMMDGDLGDGMGVIAASSSTRKKSQSSNGVMGATLPRAELLRRSGQGGENTWIPRLKITERQLTIPWKLPHTGKNIYILTL